jgi:hypothetical protein
MIEAECMMRSSTDRELRQAIYYSRDAGEKCDGKSCKVTFLDTQNTSDQFDLQDVRLLGDQGPW